MKIIILTLFTYFSVSSEYHYPYPDNPSKSIYKERRNELASNIEDYQAFIAFTSDFYSKTNYQTFRQSSNMLYLTGFPDKEAILLLDHNGIDIDGEIVSEILFMRFQDENDKIWNGIKITKQYVEKELGFEKVVDIENFLDFMREYCQTKSELLIAPFTKGKHFKPYLNSENKAIELDIDIIDEIKRINPYQLIKVDNRYLKSMRAIKDNSEIELLQKAVDISVLAHKEAIKNISPGMYEYQIEAIIEGKFHYEGAENNGYNSIVGSGINSCYLHYTTNREKLISGDLILMDCGAVYHGYTADITRTVPVSGKFNNQQKAIYNLVRKAQDSVIKLCREGINFFATDSLAKELIANELIKLGILEDRRNIKKYFPHGTSHYLGLDVHDVGTYDTLQAGNVITIEPGVYIPAGSDCDPKWWNIGVRIEDDILILKDSCVVLSEKLPKTIDEIEKLMEPK